jgi:excisionase family DNA binding protein
MSAEIRVLDQEREPHFTQKSLAAYWTVTDRTIRNMIKAGEITGTWIRGTWRISAEEVRSYERHRRDQRAAA